MLHAPHCKPHAACPPHPPPTLSTHSLAQREQQRLQQRVAETAGCCFQPRLDPKSRALASKQPPIHQRVQEVQAAKHAKLARLQVTSVIKLVCRWMCVCVQVVEIDCVFPVCNCLSHGCTRLIYPFYKLLMLVHTNTSSHNMRCFATPMHLSHSTWRNKHTPINRPCAPHH